MNDVRKITFTVNGVTYTPATFAESHLEGALRTHFPSGWSQHVKPELNADGNFRLRFPASANLGSIFAAIGEALLRLVKHIASMAFDPTDHTITVKFQPAT